MGRTDLYLLVQSPYMGRTDPIFSGKVLKYRSSVRPISEKAPYMGRQSSQFLKRFLIYEPPVSLFLVGSPYRCTLGV